MAAKSKNVFIEKLGNIVDKHNNTYYRKIKMMSINVRTSTCIDFGNEN